MTTIAQAIAYGRRALAEMEPAMVRQLLDQYALVWRHIEGRLSEVEGLITAAIARGEDVDDAWLRRQPWWDSTLRSIETEMSRYTTGMAQAIAAGEASSIGVARTVTTSIGEYITQEAAKRGISVQGSIRGYVNPGAFERWVVAQQPGSPVRKAIDNYGDRVSESVRKQMTEGLAAGEHPRSIVRKIVSEVGPEANEGRLHTISRTEVHRAYRGSLRDTMESWGPDVVRGWRWTSSLGPRTCPACLSQHNREFPFDAYPDRFHVSCRCVISPIPVTGLMPSRPVGRTGDEWLRDQPAKVQRHILRTQDRYDAFTKDGYTLADFTTVRHSPTWGDSLAVRSMREVRA